jgi:hypothetical protein
MLFLQKNNGPPPPMWNGPVRRVALPPPSFVLSLRSSVFELTVLNRCRNHAALGGGGGGGGGGNFQALPGR